MVNDKPKDISNEEIQQLMASGLNASQIADKAGVSKQAIYKRIKSMGQTIIGLSLYEESAIFGRHLKTLDQIIKVNEECWKMINNPKCKEFVKLQAMRRIEAQNELQLKLVQSLYSIHEVKEFQRTVLEVLSEVDISFRDEVLNRFRKRRSLAALVASSGKKPIPNKNIINSAENPASLATINSTINNNANNTSVDNDDSIDSQDDNFDDITETV